MTNKQSAIKIIKQLRRDGFEALLAGGCVRDMLLGRTASDYDVATDARPDDVVKMFRRTLKVGAKFGVVIVLMQGRQVEVATFRTEGGYTNGRHPASVKFAGAAKDASRRDFTINGMFYDPLSDKVIDYVDGQADLKNQIVRTIGRPEERFSEDYLRMLRAARFSTQLGFAIEPGTFSAVCSNAKNIARISGERIAIELEGILVNPNRSTGASMLIDSGLAEAIFPGFAGELKRHRLTQINTVRELKVEEQCKSVSKKLNSAAYFAVGVLSHLKKKVDFVLALAGFFAGFETKFAIERCQILKLSRNRNKHIKFLLTNRGKLLNDRMSLAELKKNLAEPYFWDLYELQRAIEKAKQSPDREGGAALIKLRKRIRDLGDVELQPQPLLNGHDLIRLGAIPGPALGQLAEELYIAQLEGNLQTPEQAQLWAQRWLQKHRSIEK